MVQTPTAGIQILPEVIRAALTTLGADTSLSLNTSYGSAMTKAFLIKQVRYALALSGLTAGEGPILIGFARGGLSVAEITSALATALVNPEDASNMGAFAMASTIFWETLRLISDHDEVSPLNETISIGGRKGIPVQEGEGIQLFAFNPTGAALTTGAAVVGAFNLIGVWLNE